MNDHDNTTSTTTSNATTSNATTNRRRVKVENAESTAPLGMVHIFNKGIKDGETTTTAAAFSRIAPRWTVTASAALAGRPRPRTRPPEARRVQ